MRYYIYFYFYFLFLFFIFYFWFSLSKLSNSSFWTAKLYHFLVHLVFKSFSLSLARKMRICNWTRYYSWYGCIFLILTIMDSIWCLSLCYNVSPIHIMTPQKVLAQIGIEPLKLAQINRKVRWEESTFIFFPLSFLSFFNYIFRSRPNTVLYQFFCLRYWRNFCLRYFFLLFCFFQFFFVFFFYPSFLIFYFFSILFFFWWKLISFFTS